MASHERDSGRSYTSGSLKHKKKINEEERKRVMQIVIEK